MNNFKKTTLCLVSLSALFATGCAQVHQTVQEDYKKNKDYVAAIKQPPVYASNPTPVTVSSGVYLGSKTPITVKKTVAPIPSNLMTPFKLRTKDAMPLVMLLGMVKERTGVQFAISSEISSKPTSTSTTQQQTVTPSVQQSAVSLPPLPGGATQQQAAPARVAPTTSNNQPSNYALSISDIDYEGTASGFLDYATAKLGISWKYENGQINVFKYETRVFDISALAGSDNIKSSIGDDSKTTSGSGKSGGIGASGSSSSKLENSSTLDMWASIEKSIKIKLSEYGKNNVYISPELGSATISDEPARLAEIEEYLKDINAKITRQVHVEYRVFEVDTNDVDTVGVDWQSVWNRPGSAIDFSASGLTNTTTLQRAGINVLTGPWTNTQFVIGALNTLGQVSVISTGQVATLNRQPAVVQNTKSNGFVSERQIAMSGSTGTTLSSTKTDYVVSGVSGTITPNIEEDGSILLKVNLTKTNNDGFDTTTDSGGQIKTANTSQVAIFQKLKVRSGQTLALTGYETTYDSSNKSGVGSADNLLLGGKREATKRKTSLVILITPYILD